MCYSIMSSLNTLFRENFKKCCKEKGYTQQEVADKLGISLDGLKHHLRKNNPYLPSVDLLYKMAKIFDGVYMISLDEEKDRLFDALIAELSEEENEL